VEKREAIADNLRALAEDLKGLVETATTDPKARQRKERYWSALYGAFGLVSTLVARKAATKIWGILTGETAPGKGAAGRSAPTSPRSESTQERSPARPAA
jgi:Protein of unknown function (DUF4235)